MECGRGGKERGQQGKGQEEVVSATGDLLQVLACLIATGASPFRIVLKMYVVKRNGLCVPCSIAETSWIIKCQMGILRHFVDASYFSVSDNSSLRPPRKQTMTTGDIGLQCFKNPGRVFFIFCQYILYIQRSFFVLFYLFFRIYVNTEDHSEVNHDLCLSVLHTIHLLFVVVIIWILMRMKLKADFRFMCSVFCCLHHL